MHQQNSSEAYLGGGMFPEVSPMLPWTFPTYSPSPATTTAAYGGGLLFNNNNNRRQLVHGLQYPIYEGKTSSYSSDHHYHHNHHLNILSESCLSQVIQSGHELQKMSAQEMMDAKALAASKSHSEAERRRRERINNHLAKLRSLLPNTTKTDKASLLAEVIQHLKELKKQTCLIAESIPIPTEMDELIVDNIASSSSSSSSDVGKVLIKASFCCQDRSDLLTDLIKTLKALRLRTLKAEIATLGVRVKNVLFITRENEDEDEDEDEEQMQCTIITSVKQALKAVMEKAPSNIIDESAGLANIKRQTTNTPPQHI